MWCMAGRIERSCANLAERVFGRVVFLFSVTDAEKNGPGRSGESESTKARAAGDRSFLPGQQGCRVPLQIRAQGKRRTERGQVCGIGEERAGHAKRTCLGTAWQQRPARGAIRAAMQAVL